MRVLCLLLSVLSLTACGGHKINQGLVRSRIVEIPGEAFEKEDVEVVKVTQVSGSQAIAETRLKTAFRLEKMEGAWKIREVRLGHGQWEKIENLARTLESVKVEETAGMLDRIVDALRKYRTAHGRLPDFSNYVQLSDALSPAYLTPLVRLDSWRQPLGAHRDSAGSISLYSAGPDGLFATKDDIRRTISD